MCCFPRDGERSDLAGHAGYGYCRDFEALITTDFDAHLVRPDRKDEPKRFGKIARYRQWIESVFDTLKGQLGLEEHGAP